MLIRNVQLLDRQMGHDGMDIERNFEKLAVNFKVIVDDAYGAVTAILAQKNPPYLNGAITSFEELAANESWRLVKPSRWISD